MGFYGESMIKVKFGLKERERVKSVLFLSYVHSMFYP